MQIEAKYTNALNSISELERHGAQNQEEWFKKRPGLYSIKEVNEKNRLIQIDRDRHALVFAQAQERAEEGGTAQLNPFQRRPCKPVQAWDTSLTWNDELQALREHKLAKAVADREKSAREDKASAPTEKLSCKEASGGEALGEDGAPLKPHERIAKFL